MKEILTDYIMKQKYGWSHAMNKLSSNLSFYFKFHFNFLLIVRAIWLALKKFLLVLFLRARLFLSALRTRILNN
jgi:hypothetical protein